MKPSIRHSQHEVDSSDNFEPWMESLRSLDDDSFQLDCSLHELTPLEGSEEPSDHAEPATPVEHYEKPNITSRWTLQFVLGIISDTLMIVFSLLIFVYAGLVLKYNGVPTDNIPMKGSLQEAARWVC